MIDERTWHGCYHSDCFRICKGARADYYQVTVTTFVNALLPLLSFLLCIARTQDANIQEQASIATLQI